MGLAFLLFCFFIWTHKPNKQPRILGRYFTLKTLKYIRASRSQSLFLQPRFILLFAFFAWVIPSGFIASNIALKYAHF
jgi:hypothetical protein